MCLTCTHCCYIYYSKSCSNNDHYNHACVILLPPQSTDPVCFRALSSELLYKLWPSPVFSAISFYACSSTCCSTIKVLSAMRIWLVTLHMTVILFVLWIEHKRVLKVSVFVFLLHIGWSEIQVWRTSVSTGTVTPEAIPAHHSWHIHTFPLMQLPLLPEHTIHMAPIPEESRVIYSVFGLLWAWK